MLPAFNQESAITFETEKEKLFSKIKDFCYVSMNSVLNYNLENIKNWR
jgi:hypothetical protein